MRGRAQHLGELEQNVFNTIVSPIAHFTQNPEVPSKDPDFSPRPGGKKKQQKDNIRTEVRHLCRDITKHWTQDCACHNFLNMFPVLTHPTTQTHHVPPPPRGAEVYLSHTPRCIGPGDGGRLPLPHASSVSLTLRTLLHLRIIKSPTALLSSQPPHSNVACLAQSTHRDALSGTRRHTHTRAQLTAVVLSIFFYRLSFFN